MSDTQEQAKTSLMSLGAQAGAQKVGERALNAIVDGCMKKYGNAKVLLGSGFKRYLKNATERYNQVHTIATGNIVRSIIGSDNIYVSIGVRYGEKNISTATVEPMLSVSKNLLVEGTGGIGKSMMMRYLFLNTANRGEYVPVLLELRKISKQSPEHISIMDLIYTCMEAFDVELPKDQFEFSLRMGKYVFLMDGFDEVRESMAKETAERIQQFCSKYPNNPCIITTRPGRDTAPLETFTTVESLPLSKQQAVELAKKIWDEDEKTKEFCRQLWDELYDNKAHREFAENPLLLSMMFLTFMRNNSLPDHLAEFYKKAFDALYNTHDSKNKGPYRREFKCEKLSENNFRKILSRFCFLSYFNQEYEFSEAKILSYLERTIIKLEIPEVCPKDYFQDLKNVVCLIIKDGEEYRFAHRSFQTYFAACYTSELSDESQANLFEDKLGGHELFWDKGDYYEILFQLEGQRFLTNALESYLHHFVEESAKQDDRDIWMIRQILGGFIVEYEREIRCGVSWLLPGEYEKRCCYNHISLFRRYIARNVDFNNSLHFDDMRCIRSYLDRVREKALRSFPGEYIIVFEEIRDTNLLSAEEKMEFMAALLRVHRVKENYVHIESWLKEIEEGRKRLKERRSMDDY